MAGCMRYCVLSKRTGMSVLACSRAKSVSVRPAETAAEDTTVGGSCCGSPASTQHSAPFVSGTSVEGSVAYTSGAPLLR